MYPVDQPSPTLPPDGYKPFYISHVGRHGARYALGETVYADILNVFSDASGRGLLTERGEEFLRVYSEFYPQVAHREGELSLKGQEQLRQIARQMYRDYPSVFDGPTHACAVSTHFHRVIASMYSFLAEARVLDPDFTFDADYGLKYLPVLLPCGDDCPGRITPRPFPEDVVREDREFYGKLVDVPGTLGVWFKDISGLGVDPEALLKDLHAVFSSFSCIDAEVPEALWTMFSFEDRYLYWERDNYRWYERFGRSPLVNDDFVEAIRGLAGDIIDKVPADWSDGVDLRLRFTHDAALAPLLTLLDVNGMGVSVADRWQVKDYWRNFDIPMACNLQIVFFRKGDETSRAGSASLADSALPAASASAVASASLAVASDDVLIQVLLNGFEATLPLPPVSPGFYRWSDFVERFSQ